MKTELETAEEKYNIYIICKDIIFRSQHKSEMIGHIQTCKRWLDYEKQEIFFLKELLKGFNSGKLANHLLKEKIKEKENKISDLQETIKFYEGEGVK